MPDPVPSPAPTPYVRKLSRDVVIYDARIAGIFHGNEQIDNSADGLINPLPARAKREECDVVQWNDTLKVRVVPDPEILDFGRSFWNSLHLCWYDLDNPLPDSNDAVGSWDADDDAVPAETNRSVAGRLLKTMPLERVSEGEGKDNTDSSHRTQIYSQYLTPARSYVDFSVPISRSENQNYAFLTAGAYNNLAPEWINPQDNPLGNRPYFHDISDEFTTLPWVIDIDVDSDNTNFTPDYGPDNTVVEDPIEEDEPGRIVLSNNDDDDGDGVMDALDGFNYDALSGTPEEQKDDQNADEDDFVRMTLHFHAKQRYQLDDLSRMRYNYNGIHLRLWNSPGDQPRKSSGPPAGNLVYPGVDYKLGDLGLGPYPHYGIQLDLWLKGLNPSINHHGDSIIVYYDVDADGMWDYSDSVHLTIMNVDIDMPYVAEEEELYPGVLIGRNDDDDNVNGRNDLKDWDVHLNVAQENDFVPFNVKCEPLIQSGVATLYAIQGGSRIRIWKWNNTAQTYDQVPLPASWDLSTETPPYTLFLECYEASNAMRDIQLRLMHNFGAPFVPDDRVSVTVVQADIDVDTNNDMIIDSNDNGEDNIEAYPPGRVIRLTLEGDPDPLDPNKDDLAEMKVRLLPNDLDIGTLSLYNSGPRLPRVWYDQNKIAEVDLWPDPKTWTVGTDLINSPMWIDGDGFPDLGKASFALVFEDDTNREIHRDNVSVFITETISWSPDCEEKASAWLAEDFLGTEDIDQFVIEIENQGFGVTRYEDRDGIWPDLDFGTATPYNFQHLFDDPGVVVYSSHGYPGKIYPIRTWAADPQGEIMIQQWIAGLSDTNDVDYELWPPPYASWMCFVGSKWLERNFKPNSDQNKAIVFWDCCYSARLSPDGSVMESGGGRWRAGYWDETDYNQNKLVIEKFFKRMNGKTDDGFRRTTGEAYDNGINYTLNLRMAGNPWTTLCPAPAKYTPMAFPDTCPGRRYGWGCVVFDTYLNTKRSAADAITQTGNPRWAGFSEGKFMLGFDYWHPLGEVVVVVYADECRNEESGQGRSMDGDRSDAAGDDYSYQY